MIQHSLGLGNHSCLLSNVIKAKLQCTILLCWEKINVLTMPGNTISDLKWSRRSWPEFSMTYGTFIVNATGIETLEFRGREWLFTSGEQN